MVHERVTGTGRSRAGSRRLCRPRRPRRMLAVSGLFAKDLYRRLDRVLGELHREVRGQEFLQQALYRMFDAHGRELKASGAQLFAHDGHVLESIARVGRMEGIGSAPLAMADFQARFDSSGERVRLIEGGVDAAQPLAYFEVAHGERPFVFLFHFEESWERGPAELLLNTA